MTTEHGGGAGSPHVRIYLDDNPQPIIDRELPADVELDTLSLTDGAHRLVIRAAGQSGREGVEEIPFVVQNGPGISISGLRPHSIRSGTVGFTPRRSALGDSGLGVGDVVIRGGLGRMVCGPHVGRAAVILELSHLQS
jgi:hypothetical protein